MYNANNIQHCNPPSNKSRYKSPIGYSSLTSGASKESRQILKGKNKDMEVNGNKGKRR